MVALPKLCFEGPSAIPSQFLMGLELPQEGKTPLNQHPQRMHKTFFLCKRNVKCFLLCSKIFNFSASQDKLKNTFKWFKRRLIFKSGEKIIKMVHLEVKLSCHTSGLPGNNIWFAAVGNQILDFMGLQYDPAQLFGYSYVLRMFEISILINDSHIYI